MQDSHLNPIRLAKEFEKFNERCFVRLLGDMHSSNFVIDVTPDFEETNFGSGLLTLISNPMREKSLSTYPNISRKTMSLSNWE